MAYITKLEEELELEILQLKRELDRVRGLGKNKIIQGDCLEVLKTLPDNYFDSLITDPPCGISFMGKNWDDHKGGMLQWINWMSEVMAESLRVMKPGACGLVWSIPRTSHWTGMALELAGFRLIDIVHHCNGCLSEDTEIFVKDKGWVHYQQCEIGDTVIGYNIENNSFSYQSVTQTYRFDYSDTAYRIESDSIEQIVSIGHRCIIEQNGAFVFREATTLEQQVSVPFLETVPLLQHTISDTQCFSGYEKYNLLRDLCKESNSQSQSSQAIRTRQSGCKTTLATVTPFHYEGVVWCVSVPDTAFIARRNGKIFVTGNSGFPKGQDISKSIDALYSAEREIIGSVKHGKKALGLMNDDSWEAKEFVNVTKPNTPEAKQWDGWKTPALKPAIEGWWLIQKPISESSIARNILKHGVGGLNIEACRIEPQDKESFSKYWDRDSISDIRGGNYNNGKSGEMDCAKYNAPSGRYPANLILSCSADCDGDNHSPDCPVSVIGEQSGISVSTGGKTKTGLQGSCYGDFKNQSLAQNSGGLGDTGTAARYFKQLPFDPETVNSVYYQAKASTKDRTCDGTVENTHPTVKSTALMEYFIKLITPPNGMVLDPFGGSGTTGVAAKNLGFNYTLIEREQEYIEIINQRLSN
jgi:site-specific DNA-methyltransferase (adenine-specific)